VAARQEPGLGAERGTQHQHTGTVSSEVCDSTQEELPWDFPGAVVLARAPEPADRFRDGAVLCQQFSARGVDPPARAREHQGTDSGGRLRDSPHTLHAREINLPHGGTLSRVDRRSAWPVRPARDDWHPEVGGGALHLEELELCRGTAAQEAPRPRRGPAAFTGLSDPLVEVVDVDLTPGHGGCAPTGPRTARGTRSGGS